MILQLIDFENAGIVDEDADVQFGEFALQVQELLVVWCDLRQIALDVSNLNLELLLQQFLALFEFLEVSGYLHNVVPELCEGGSHLLADSLRAAGYGHPALVFVPDVNLRGQEEEVQLFDQWEEPTKDEGGSHNGEEGLVLHFSNYAFYYILFYYF